MTDRKDMTELELDQLFGAARETQADPDIAPSAALMARIMADAAAEIAARKTPMDLARPGAGQAGAKNSILDTIKEALGGWRGMAGVATAGVAGLAIGLGAPDMVTDFTLGSSSATETISADAGLDGLTSSFYDLAVEG